MNSAAMNWKQLLSTRRLGSDKPGRESYERSPYQRDFDRIVFSGSFRRLQDKTQVFPLTTGNYVRTRLTHSLECSSIARSLGTAAGNFICRNFDTGGATPSDIGAVVAAAALAHDIGNPPLGHAGEEAIRYWFTHSPKAQSIRERLTSAEIQDFTMFEGNAQGLRILTELEMPDQYGGMRLTCATLGTFVKYPCTSSADPRPRGVAGKKFNIFGTELPLFEEVAAECGLIRIGPGAWQRHPLAFLVEAADDIAYLTVDFEDGQRLGMIDHAELARLFLEIIGSSRSEEYAKKLDSPVRRAEFLRAQVIGRLVVETSRRFEELHDQLLRGEAMNPLTDELKYRDVLKEIRALSTKKIYNNVKVAEVVGAGFEMVSGMLDIFVPSVEEMAAERRGGPAASYRSRRIAAMLPEHAMALEDPRWVESTGFRLQQVLDYVAGMTDSYAVSLYQKLKGISL